MLIQVCKSSAHSFLSDLNKIQNDNSDCTCEMMITASAVRERRYTSTVRKSLPALHTRTIAPTAALAAGLRKYQFLWTANIRAIAINCSSRRSGKNNCKSQGRKHAYQSAQESAHLRRKAWTCGFNTKENAASDFLLLDPFPVITRRALEHLILRGKTIISG